MLQYSNILNNFKVKKKINENIQAQNTQYSQDDKSCLVVTVDSYGIFISLD